MVGQPRHRGEQQVAELVRVGVPGLQVSSVALIGEGVDHLAYEVNGELVVRFSKEDDPTRRAELIRSETGLLAAVAQISPLPVPEPVFTDAERGCWAYAKIPGTPLLDLPRTAAAALRPSPRRHARQVPRRPARGPQRADGSVREPGPGADG
jgi:hypothetical protein